jgi:hypothetical protein
MISIAHPTPGIEEEEAVLRVLKISSYAMPQCNWHIFIIPIRNEVTTCYPRIAELQSMFSID